MAQVASYISEHKFDGLEQIKSIIIVNSEKEIVFSFDNSEYKNTKDEEVVSKFILAMDSFAREIGGYDLKMVELGSDKIYSLRDEPTGFLFIALSHNKSKTKKISKRLKKIRNLFIKECINDTGFLTTDKEEIEMKFCQALEKIDAKSLNIDNFLTSL
ncbi:MAG: hypothetical protein EU551_03555 [Promethearchaeota archaeon]|nr:MAG: hypothetical protein EU551_03555 [Candidatus Lokiarchaeota archaeon]